MYFNATSTFTITKLSLKGGSAVQRIWIRSTTNGTNWILNNIVSHTVSYVDVRDSDARPGLTILANDGTNLDS